MSGLRTHREIQVYKQHREKVENAVSNIDYSAPKLPIRVYVNTGKLYEDMFRLAQIENQNRDLLKHINYINRTKGKVDCYGIKGIKIKSKFLIRQLQQKADEERNTKFLSTLKDKLDPSPYSQKVLLPDWKKNLQSMIFSSRYPDFYKKREKDWSICPPEIKSDPSLRKTCFFDLQIGDIKTRMYIEIYADIVPVSAKNFISLCTGWTNFSYKKTLFYRIIPGLFCVGGDVVKFLGHDATSIYGNNFADENYILEHNGPGVVAQYNFIQGFNTSHFFITFKKLISFNKRFVVIGRVVKNLHPLHMIEECGTKSGKPLTKVVVSDCGVCT